MKKKLIWFPDRRPRAIFSGIIELGIIILAWIWFDWKLALILYLLIWARNLGMSNRGLE